MIYYINGGKFNNVVLRANYMELNFLETASYLLLLIVLRQSKSRFSIQLKEIFWLKNIFHNPIMPMTVESNMLSLAIIRLALHFTGL
jgi:hypothetical protein